MPSKVAVALKSPEDVIPHLGSPSHWKEGRSAKAVADSWFKARNLPEKVRAVLEQAEEYRGAELIDAWLERCVDLGDGHRPTQTDLMAVLGLDGELAVLAVEGKVDETLGPRVAEWRDGSSAREHRLAMLVKLLGMEHAEIGPLRYQLFHRTASAVLEARRYRARRAVMLVQSFCPRASWHEDFQRFFAARGLGNLAKDEISDPFDADGVELRVGWVADEVPQ